MASKVLLISVNQCTFPYPVFPLGIAHVASALNAAGYATEIVDLQISTVGLAETVSAVRPDYIGLSLRNIDNIDPVDTDFFAPALAEAAQKVRTVTTVPVILGGSGFSLFPRELLQLTEADFGICGEGEHALVSLLNCLAASQPYDTIPGLVYRKNGTICTNPKTTCPADTIQPAYRPKKLVDVYLRHSAMLNIQTQRGCAYTCCYCTYPLIEGTAFRFRKPAVVCDEIEEIIRCGARYFFIVDSVFNNSEEHVRGICDEILRRNLQVQWGCYLRPQGISQSLMALMARAGLKHVEFGTDSLCDSVLEAYGKGFGVSDVIQASTCALNAKVKYAHFLIIGGPTETEKTIQEGLANAGFVKKSVFFPCVGMRLYPDTPLYRFALNEGAISPEKNLFDPYFYITSQVSLERILHLLAEHNARAKNWIVGKPDAALQKVMINLRSLGVLGPLWDYIIR